jgi:HTH-type transcriptional regulator/antitoxin HigA
MTKTTETPAERRPLPDTWEELTAQLPLRPIHDDIEYDNAVGRLDLLAVLEERIADQEDYLETLSALVERYDDEHFAIDDSGISPIEVLRYLCDQNGLTASALGELLGNRSLGSKVLREERQLSKEHIRKLSDRFSVSSDLFL